MKRASRKRKMSQMEVTEVTPSKKPKLTDTPLTPSSKVNIFKIETNLCNGKPLSKAIELGDEDFERIWTKALRHDWDDVKGCISKRFDNAIKITFELYTETSLKAIVNDTEFTYQRNALSPETFTFKVLGLHNIREARIGEVVKVNARGTNFEVKPVQILEWMDEYGSLIGEYRYSLSAICNLPFFWLKHRQSSAKPTHKDTSLLVSRLECKSLLSNTRLIEQSFSVCWYLLSTKASQLGKLPYSRNLLSIFVTSSYSYLKNAIGKDTDGITFELELKEHIPEWLPIQGQKIRIFYYGMQKQCNSCWTLGHQRWQCKGKKTNWRGYVDGMIASGRFAPAMYGKWVNKPMPKPVQDTDLRAMLNDPEKMKQMLQIFNVMQGQSDASKSKEKKGQSPRKKLVAKKRGNQKPDKKAPPRKKK